MGFHNVDITAHPLISVTTVHSARDVGKAAAKLLLDPVEARIGAYGSCRRLSCGDR